MDMTNTKTGKAISAARRRFIVATAAAGGGLQRWGSRCQATP